MKIKSFRDAITHNTQHKISLSGGDSDTGYRLVKFEAMPQVPDGSHESVLQIFTKKQSAASVQIDFSNDTLLAAIWYAFEGSGSGDAAGYMKQIFDTVVVNQDIYITCKGGQGKNMNYYIELEEVKMTNGEQAVVNFRAALLHGE